MERDAFEKIVAEAVENIPEKFKEKLKNVAFVVEDVPSEETRKREHLMPGETLLGYYQGVPMTHRGEGYGVGPTFPDTITIYQRSIEAAVGLEVENVTQCVKDTVWHEVAHYFGMDEREVRSREKEKGIR